MRNAKASDLRRGPTKNGTNRDGNEKARKGLGCTNRSIRMDWFGRAGKRSAKYSPTGNKVARQGGMVALFDEGVEVSDEFLPYWEQVGDAYPRDSFFDGSPVYTRDSHTGYCYAVEDPFDWDYGYEPYGGYDDPPYGDIADEAWDWYERQQVAA